MSAVVGLRLTDVPLEVVSLVFSFLHVADLCRVSAVCKDWNTLANADGLWKTQCALRWRQKPGAHLDMVVHFRANLSHPQAVGTLSVAEMKTVLQKRRITERFFEKSDIQAAVARPHTDVVVERAMTSKWKASYAAAEADSRRTLLTLEEICANDWFVFFKHNGSYVRAFQCRFYTNFRYHSSDGNEFDWKFFGTSMVQVGDFPPLTIKRNPEDWSWRMQNNFAKLVPHDSPYHGGEENF